jgi:hypothetical protein
VFVMKTFSNDGITRWDTERGVPSLILQAFAVALFCALCLRPSSASQPLTVAAAKQSAPQLGSQQVLVRGHFWWGKEGSMIYDGGYKATLKVEYPPAYNAKYPGLSILHLAREHKFATVTGRLRMDTGGHVVLVADDLQFSDKAN